MRVLFTVLGGLAIVAGALVMAFLALSFVAADFTTLRQDAGDVGVLLFVATPVVIGLLAWLNSRGWRLFGD